LAGAIEGVRRGEPLSRTQGRRRLRAHRHLRKAGLGLLAALALAPGGSAEAATRRAVIQGVQDRDLRTLLERAVGEERRPPASRIDARRRARKAADAVVAALRSEGFYDYTVDPDIGEGDAPQAVVKVDAGPRYALASP